MGVRDVIKRDPVRVAQEILADPAERARRNLAKRRMSLYRENADDVTRRELEGVFDDPTVRSRVLKWIPLASSRSVVRRVVDLVARPVYAVAPVRVVEPESAQASYDEIVRTARTNAAMDLACRIAEAANHALIYTRYIARKKRICHDVIAPDAVTVIPDPDVPTDWLALLFAIPGEGGKVHWQYVDDAETFRLDHEGSLVPKTQTPLGLRRPNFTWVHRTERSGAFWESMRGRSLERAELGVNMLNLLAMRGLKASGFKKLAIVGDLANFPKGQSLDEESAIVAGEGVAISEVSSQMDAANYIALQQEIVADAAASRGISRARLNATGAQDSDDAGLEEERGELVGVMYEAELDVFDVVKMVSQESETKIPEDATLRVDFGELHHRVDRKTELEIETGERNAGMANYLDHIKRRNPEIRSDADALEEFIRNVKLNATCLELITARNLSQGATPENPGQSPEENGAMGPAVRDGKMSGDEAAAKAEGGAPEPESEE